VAQLDLYRGPPRSSYLLVLTRAQARHAGLDVANDVVSAERSDPYTCPPLWPGSVAPVEAGSLWAWDRRAEGAGPAVPVLVRLGWIVVVADTSRRSEACQRLSRAGWPVRYRTGHGLRRYATPCKMERPGSAATDPGHNPRHKEETPWDA
jgi:hypothetical protein